jgi:3-dehydroquinate synthase
MEISNLPENIILTENPNQALGEFFTKRTYSKLMVLIDENTLAHCYPIIKDSLPAHELIEISSGEEYKTLSTCQLIWDKMTTIAADRNALLVNLGGGVISDMGGFCAATYKRGIAFINIPTTLLAQVDASIGGKLGIDYNGFKNHIGLFCEPGLVILSASFLATLPKRELISGYAEVLKHGLIADANYWQGLGTAIDKIDWQKIIQRSVEIKYEVISADPKEKGLRKILNFGHTIGHCIESFYLTQKDQKLLHGEAIAIGMICEAFIAHRKKMIDQQMLQQINSKLKAIYGLHPIQQKDLASIVDLAIQDKKNKNNTILMALLKGIGEVEWDVAVTEKEITESLLAYQTL